MGLFSAGRSMLGRAGKGAAIGGAAGYGSTGDYRGAMGGAVGGAAFGAAMPFAGRALSNRFGSISGNLQRGLGAGMRGSRSLANYGAGMARGAGISSNAGFGMLRAGNLGQRGMGAASSFIGKNSVSVNKYGGMGLAALGLGASAHIGSSVIGSNRGF